MRQFVVIIIVAIVLIGLVFWAFRSPANPSSSPTPTSPSTTADNQNPLDKNVVSIENSSFNPAEITIKAGDPVSFKNNDSIVHSVTFEEFDSGELKPGSTFLHAFNKAGTYEYHCKIHPSMEGKVIVQ